MLSQNQLQVVKEKKLQAFCKNHDFGDTLLWF